MGKEGRKKGRKKTKKEKGKKERRKENNNNKKTENPKPELLFYKLSRSLIDEIIKYTDIYFLENRDIMQAQSLVLMLLTAEIQCSHF